MKRFNKSKPGIALFILMTALVTLSLVFRELFNSSTNQATRVRNSADRIQALYLARSSLNIVRFFLMIDKVLDTQLGQTSATQRSDTLNELWNNPQYFPLKVEEIKALTQQANGENKDDPPAPPDPAFIKKCEEFFEDFPGTTTSITTDLSSKISLNDLNPQTNLMVLEELLKPNIEFIRHLNELNITPEALAREILDYADIDSKETETNAEESFAYSALQLDYGPKNRPYTNMDELKLVPHVDEAVFQYLSEYVNPYTPARNVSKLINANTVSKQVFQSLLVDVPDADIVAAHFIKDRTENKRVYTEENVEKTIRDVLQLDKDKIRSQLLTGVSNAFKIETTVNVNKIELRLETIIDRAQGTNDTDKILIMRVSP